MFCVLLFAPATGGWGGAKNARPAANRVMRLCVAAFCVALEASRLRLLAAALQMSAAGDDTRAAGKWRNHVPARRGQRGGTRHTNAAAKLRSANRAKHVRRVSSFGRRRSAFATTLRFVSRPPPPPLFAAGGGALYRPADRRRRRRETKGGAAGSRAPPFRRRRNSRRNRSRSAGGRARQLIFACRLFAFASEAADASRSIISQRRRPTGAGAGAATATATASDAARYMHVRALASALPTRPNLAAAGRLSWRGAGSS